MIKNLMKMASTVIPLQSMSYTPYASLTINDVGLEVTTYGTTQTLKASIQAVPRTTYEALGLDFQKKYVSVFIERNLLDLGRGVSGDKFTYNGETYQVESETDWYNVDGWTSLMAVQID